MFIIVKLAIGVEATAVGVTTIVNMVIVDAIVVGVADVRRA